MSVSMNYKRKTVYGKRTFIGEKSKVVLSIVPTFSCVLLRFRVDASERCRKLIGVREVRSFPSGSLLLRDGDPKEQDGSEHYISVEALEATAFVEEWNTLQAIEVEIETLGTDVDVCLVAEVAVTP